jgi:hypothetical protein
MVNATAKRNRWVWSLSRLDSMRVDRKFGFGKSPELMGCPYENRPGLHTPAHFILQIET